MSVSIHNILSLPSLQQARVAAGRMGLSQTVTSISVLESIDKNKTGVDFPELAHHSGSEVVITAFADAKDSVEEQCLTIRKLHEKGEIAIILFYVGVIVKELTQPVLDLCDELAMPLIVMPENNVALQYGDVIIEVSEAIIEDKRQNTSFSTEVIDILSRVPISQRTISTVLSHLRNQIHCSIFLLDATERILNYAEWPNGYNLPISDVLRNLDFNQSSTDIQPVTINQTTHYVASELLTVNDNIITILIIRETPQIPIEWRKQIKFILRTYINLWTEGYGDIDSRQLISAIIHGENDKIRHVSESLSLSLGELRSVYLIFQTENTHEYESLSAVKKQLSELLSAYRSWFVCDIFDETLLLLTLGKPLDHEITEALSEADADSSDFSIISGNLLNGLPEIREIYWNYVKCRKYLTKMFPTRNRFTTGELLVIEQAVRYFEENTDVSAITERLTKPLEGNPLAEEFLKTAQVFLLDAEGSLPRTSQYMYLHLNTIKYRIKILESLLGYKPTRIPEVGNLYLAALILRLKN